MELLDPGVSSLISVGERTRDQMSQVGQIYVYLPRSNSDRFADETDEPGALRLPDGIMNLHTTCSGSSIHSSAHTENLAH